MSNLTFSDKLIERPETGWKFERATNHPGEILREEFLVPLGLSASALALHLQAPAPQLRAILREQREVTPDLAMRLSRCFRTTIQFWLKMQALHDLTKAQQVSGAKIEREVEPLEMTA